MRGKPCKLIECDRIMSQLLIDLATDESETSSPIKMTHQESNKEVVYLSRTRKRTLRLKLVIDKINDMKMELSGKETLRKNGKTKVDAEPPPKTGNSAVRKRVEDAVDIGQGGDRLHGTSKTRIDVAMVPPILMAGLRSNSYKPRGETALLLEQR